MPLETGTYISDLVTSNPAHSDGLNNADAHARLIKATIKATFPNITGPLNSTNAAIDTTVTTVANGVTTLADAGAVFKTNSGDGFTNPGSGQIGIKLFGAANQVTFTYNGSTFLTTMAVNGPITSPYPVTAPGIVPIGGMIMWLVDTLPSVGQWCWANGGVLSRTGNGAALWALWGGTSPYGLGDGVTTFNVINMQEAVPVGRSGMGGGSSPGLLNSISSGVKGVLGGVFGSDTVTLGTSNLPPYTPAGSIASQINYGGGLQNAFAFLSPGAPGNVGVGGTAQGGQSINLNPNLLVASTWTGSPQGGTSTPLNNVGPRRVVDFIIRIG